MIFHQLPTNHRLNSLPDQNQIPEEELQDTINNSKIMKTQIADQVCLVTGDTFNDDITPDVASEKARQCINCSYLMVKAQTGFSFEFKFICPTVKYIIKKVPKGSLYLFLTNKEEQIRKLVITLRGDSFNETI